MQSFKLAPAQEAVVRLRYATVLYEETENSIQAEEALSKGVIFTIYRPDKMLMLSRS